MNHNAVFFCLSNNNGMETTKQKGFTLNDLLMAVAIGAVVVGLGAPSFSEMVQEARFSSSMNEFISASAYARLEAVKRNETVSMCLADETSGGSFVCDQDGLDLVVFVDVNGNSRRDNGETILRDTQFRSKVEAVHFPNAGAAGDTDGFGVTFDGSGKRVDDNANSWPGTRLSVCASETSSKSKVINFSSTGVATVHANVSDSDKAKCDSTPSGGDGGDGGGGRGGR